VQKVVLKFLAEKSSQVKSTDLASETIDARCVDCVRSIVGFRGVRPDPDETPDEYKLTGFG
jgi:hypothetical protein